MNTLNSLSNKSGAKHSSLNLNWDHHRSRTCHVVNRAVSRPHLWLTFPANPAFR